MGLLVKDVREKPVPLSRNLYGYVHVKNFAAQNPLSPQCLDVSVQNSEFWKTLISPSIINVADRGKSSLKSQIYKGPWLFKFNNINLSLS